MVNEIIAQDAELVNTDRQNKTYRNKILWQR